MAIISDQSFYLLDTLRRHIALSAEVYNTRLLACHVSKYDSIIIYMRMKGSPIKVGGEHHMGKAFHLGRHRLS